MTDAFWIAAFGFATTALGQVVSVVYSRRSSKSSLANGEVLNEVHDKVNGGLKAAVASAEDQARRRTLPRILIVDDDENDILLAKPPLLAFGCEVFTARTAFETERLLLENIGPGRGFPFDFVLVDLRMPDRQSEDVFELFRTKAPRVPLVILTGHTMGVIPPGVDNLPRYWLQKPLNEEQVQSLLEQFQIPYHRKVGDQFEV